MNIFTEVKNSIKQAKKFRGCCFLNAFFYFLLSLIIRQAHSKKIVRYADLILYFRIGPVIYLVAKAFFLNGNYKQAIILYEEVLQKNPEHVESYYGLSEVYRLMGDTKKARKVVIEVFEFSGRLKSWLLLASLVNTQEEFEELLLLWQKERQRWKIPIYHYNVNDYLITAALRAKQYNEALNIVQVLEENVYAKDFYLPVSTPKNFSINEAKKALLDLKFILDSNGVIFFLVSGTLLGCIRDKKILKHDKDIDVGIWDDIDLNNLKRIIACSGRFEVSPMRSPYCLRVKHVNGIAIDIFIHYRDEKEYWHGGSKLKWYNTPFQLTTYMFLGKKFFIPKDFDLYLSENYGDWKVEKKKFDSAFDTTNAKIINIHELKIHIYKKLILNLNSHSSLEIETYRKILKEINEIKNDK